MAIRARFQSYLAKANTCISFILLQFRDNIIQHDKHRRNFIKKAAIAITGLSAGYSIYDFSSQKKEKPTPMNDSSGNDSAVIKVRELQFTWDTLDPFIFCVHYEDFYPEGNEEMSPKPRTAGRSLGQDFGHKD